VSTLPFVDYYEALQLSPRATAETVDRVYRLLAKRYHPDNQETGDLDRFTALAAAHAVLADPERRAAYDVKYEEVQGVQWKIFDQSSAKDGREEDRRIFDAVLSLLYVERRRNPKSGGLGAILLERLLGVPEQHLEFPLWYMKQHRWIEIMDNGQIGITILGVDRLIEKDTAAARADRLLPESSLAGQGRSDGLGPKRLDRATG
jgi:curved DNA-binding protein CbpA